jgi:hypothetical protein
VNQPQQKSGFARPTGAPDQVYNRHAAANASCPIRLAANAGVRWTGRFRGGEVRFPPLGPLWLLLTSPSARRLDLSPLMIASPLCRVSDCRGFARVRALSRPSLMAPAAPCASHRSRPFCFPLFSLGSTSRSCGITLSVQFLPDDLFVGRWALRGAAAVDAWITLMEAARSTAAVRRSLANPRCLATVEVATAPGWPAGAVIF